MNTPKAAQQLIDDANAADGFAATVIENTAHGFSVEITRRGVFAGAAHWSVQMFGGSKGKLDFVVSSGSTGVRFSYGSCTDYAGKHHEVNSCRQFRLRVGLAA
jgi:hypothetical protein